MKKRIAKNFVVEIRKRRGRKSTTAGGGLIARTFAKLQSQPSLVAQT